MKKVVVAVGGSSGAIYAKVLFDRLVQLQDQWSAVGVVMSPNARFNWKFELEQEDYGEYPFDFYEKNDFMAPFASGSARYDTMIVCPCSMGLLGRIAAGISNDLTTRAADVVLKERRRLVLMVRETPFHLGHLRSMTQVTEMGAIVMPPLPAFYTRPQTIDDIVNHSVGRALDLFGIDAGNMLRWGETVGLRGPKP